MIHVLADMSIMHRRSPTSKRISNRLQDDLT